MRREAPGLGGPHQGAGQGERHRRVRLSHRTGRRHLRRGAVDRSIRLARHLPRLRRDFAAVARALVRRAAAQDRYLAQRRGNQPGPWCSGKEACGDEPVLFSSNYVWYFMLSWLPGFLVNERGFSMHEMEHVTTLGYMDQRPERARRRLGHRPLRCDPRVGEFRL